MRTRLTDFFPFNKYDCKCIKQLHTAQLRSNKSTVTPYCLLLYKNCTVIKHFSLFLYDYRHFSTKIFLLILREWRGNVCSSKLVYNLIRVPTPLGAVTSQLTLTRGPDIPLVSRTYCLFDLSSSEQNANARKDSCYDRAPDLVWLKSPFTPCGQD